MQISINNTLFARSAMIISKQQSAENWIDSRSNLMSSVNSGYYRKRLQSVPDRSIWTQSGFKLNRTNLNRSQSIYVWTWSNSQILLVPIGFSGRNFSVDFHAVPLIALFRRNNSRNSYFFVNQKIGCSVVFQTKAQLQLYYCKAIWKRIC